MFESHAVEEGRIAFVYIACRRRRRISLVCVVALFVREEVGLVWFGLRPLEEEGLVWFGSHALRKREQRVLLFPNLHQIRW